MRAAARQRLAFFRLIKRPRRRDCVYHLFALLLTLVFYLRLIQRSFSRTRSARRAPNIRLLRRFFARRCPEKIFRLPSVPQSRRRLNPASIRRLFAAIRRRVFPVKPRFRLSTRETAAAAA